MRHDDWRRYVAPAAFLVAATIAIVLIRNGIEAGKSPARPATTANGVGTNKQVATTSRTTAKRGARRYWTVQAGDTFAVIASETGVPVSRLQKLNPKVKSTSLFIGQKVRIE